MGLLAGRGRHAEMLLEGFAEVKWAGETELYGRFADVTDSILQQFIRLLHAQLIVKFLGGCPCDFRKNLPESAHAESCIPGHGLNRPSGADLPPHFFNYAGNSLPMRMWGCLNFYSNGPVAKQHTEPC